MLKLLQRVFGFMTIAFALYGLITKNYLYNGIMLLSLGFLMLVIGIQEIQNNKKIFGWLCIVIFLFSIYISIQSYL